MQEVIQEYQAMIKISNQIRNEKIAAAKKSADETYDLATNEARAYLDEALSANYQKARDFAEAHFDSDQWCSVYRLHTDGIEVGYNNDNGPDDTCIMPWSEMAYVK